MLSLSYICSLVFVIELQKVTVDHAIDNLEILMIKKSSHQIFGIKLHHLESIVK